MQPTTDEEEGCASEDEGCASEDEEVEEEAEAEARAAPRSAPSPAPSHQPLPLCVAQAAGAKARSREGKYSWATVQAALKYMASMHFLKQD